MCVGGGVTWVSAGASQGPLVLRCVERLVAANVSRAGTCHPPQTEPELSPLPEGYLLAGFQQRRPRRPVDCAVHPATAQHAACIWEWQRRLLSMQL